MKILIFAEKATSPDIQSHALGWFNALSTHSNFEVKLWNEKENISSFDIFDTFQPDLFWCHSKHLNRSLVRVLLDKQFEETRVVIFLSDLEDMDDNEKKYVEQLKYKYSIMFSQNFKNYLPNFSGITCHSCLPAADITRFQPKEIDSEYYSKISFIGQWEASKEENIKKYIYPYLNSGIKIFGFGNWPVTNHLGIISDNETFCKIISNSEMNLSITNNRGWYPSERIFKIMACKGTLAIQIPNPEYYNMFKNLTYILLQDFIEHSNYKTVKNSYQWLLDNHTYEHRIRQVFQTLGINHG